MRFRLSTTLDAPADSVWAAVQQTETLREVARGLLGFRSIDAKPLPEQWHAGQRVTIRMLLFGVLPAWKHTIEMVALNDRRREFQTRESGGPLRVWNHRVQVEVCGKGRSLYTDEVELAAGVLTPLAWLTAAVFFAYRQSRWRRLARRLTQVTS